MGNVFKCNTWLLILDPEVRLRNEKSERLRENEKKQTITISIAAWNYDTEIIIDLINQAIQDFRVKYRIGFENLAYLQSIETKCKPILRAAFSWQNIVSFEREIHLRPCFWLFCCCIFTILFKYYLKGHLKAKTSTLNLPQSLWIMLDYANL